MKVYRKVIQIGFAAITVVMTAHCTAADPSVIDFETFISRQEADSNLFGLSEKTTRLPGHANYYKK